MKNNILIIRIFFLLVCLLGCILIWYQIGAWGLWRVLLVGMCVGALVILTDLLLEGFSLRSLSAVTFGLAIGGLIAYLITHSPLFKPLKDDPRLEQMLKAQKEGHEVGSHTVSHYNAYSWRAFQWQEEFSQYNQILYPLFKQREVRVILTKREFILAVGQSLYIWNLKVVWLDENLSADA